jgi:SAM-dependent methyltransferase
LPAPKPSQKDYLGLQLRDLPYFRALLRAVEARAYETIELPVPTFDLGCGDGHFAKMAFDRKLEVGLDPWTGPVHEAARRNSYLSVVQGGGDHLPFPDESFASAVSNSVLEHIADLEPVLSEMARVLRPGAPFIFCVPNHNFLPNLSVARFFDRLDWSGMAQAYRRFFNRISRHHHCDAPEIWTPRLERAGFEVVRWWHYFSPKALAVLEWGHYFGLPSLVSHVLFRRWMLVKQKWNLALTRAIVEPYYREPAEQINGVYSFYITRRKRQ